MEINKQLFEDVLSGKLKGIFVLKNGKQFNDKLLTDIYKSTVVLGGTTFYFNGKPIVSCYNGILDIVDFIPSTDMKENELTIVIPDGKTIDWDESKKQNKIILKDKPLTYKDICEKLFENEYFYIGADGTIRPSNAYCSCSYYNNATTEHQLECILAKNKLANVAKYLNDGWKPIFASSIFLLKQTSTGVLAFEVANDSCASGCGSIWFKSKDLARQAIKILGEETVKLALEPLGI